MCVCVCVCVCLCVMCLHGQEVTVCNVIHTRGHIHILAAVSTKWAGLNNILNCDYCGTYGGHLVFIC